MKNSFNLILTGLLLVLFGCSTEKGSIHVNLDKSKTVSPIIYGWHYEEIGMIGEGGLYAEMVRNRGLEEANPPRGLVVKDGVYANIPNPTGKNKQVYEIDPLIGWGSLPGNETISLERVDTKPLNKKNPHSLRVDISQLSKEKAYG